MQQLTLTTHWRGGIVLQRIASRVDTFSRLFGIRGIGSLHYVAYALNHGLTGARSHEVVDLTVSAVATSIVIHGLTSQPLVAWYESCDKKEAR